MPRPEAPQHHIVLRWKVLGLFLKPFLLLLMTI